MDSNSVENQNSENPKPASSPATGIRPTFITVLCILTFIGSGWGIFDSITDYLAADTAESAVGLVEDAMDEAMTDLEDEDMTESQMDFVESLLGGITENLTAENIRRIAIGTLISCIITLIGGLMMWNLRKKGYYVYILGILIYVIVPAFVLSGILGAAYAGFTGFIGFVFILLYGLNLKHMH